jgi:cytosine permease
MRRGWRGLLDRVDAVANAHATTPVPADQSVAAHRVALVLFGVAFTLTTLYVGAELALRLGLRVATLAVVIGSAILAGMSVPASIVGARTRLSTYMIVSHVFGGHGARLVNLVLAITLLGWYAVTADLFGRTFFLAAAATPLAGVPQWVWTVSSSTLVVLTTVLGFKAIDRLSLFAAPLLIALTVWVAWRSLGVASWQELARVPGTGGDLATGISAVVGGMIVGVVLMPDLTRYSRTTLDCAVISVAGNGVGGAVALVLAIVPALAFHELDPMKYLGALGAVVAGFVVLVASTWTMNAVNLYSTGLVTSTALRGVGYGRLVVLSGVLGTVLAVAGVANRMIDFLVVLGVVVPPILAVYLTDFFVLGRVDYRSPGEGPAATTNVAGLGACVAGALVGLAATRAGWSPSGVPTIESFVSAGLVYAVLERLRTRVGRDRGWRPVADA